MIIFNKVIVLLISVCFNIENVSFSCTYRTKNIENLFLLKTIPHIPLKNCYKA